MVRRALLASALAALPISTVYGQMPEHGPMATFHYLTTEGMAGKTITGAPYSAESVTTSTRVLGDGTRITNSNTSTVYRDSQGRVRREQTLGMMGPWSTEQGPTKLIFITDPVSKENYVLHPDTKTAEKMSLPDLSTPKGLIAAKLLAESKASAGTKTQTSETIETHVMIRGGGPAVAGTSDSIRIMRRDDANTKTDSLGSQSIEGLQVEGTRITNTMPAGAIGNDRPIVTTIENWYSPELQIMVKSHTVDPQAGDTDFQLHNVTRAEPSPSLFQIPADYKVTEPTGNVMYRKFDNKD